MKIRCKKTFEGYGAVFKQGEYYCIDRDSTESCYVYSEKNAQNPNYSTGCRFYYHNWFGTTRHLDIFEIYFCDIKDVRKQKLNKIAQIHKQI